GGGIFVWNGSITVKDGFGLHNNTATSGGDDIYNNGNGAKVNLGTVDTSAILTDCEHPITDWYYDNEDARWSYKECTEQDDCLELYDHVGETYTGEFGLKAAHGELELVFTVTWVNYDDSVLETDEGVEYGATPEYNGATPTRPATSQYTYTFAGWDPEISEVIGNITYKAIYTQKENSVTPEPEPTPSQTNTNTYKVPKTGID
ncbi:MAG: hypothetical protein IKX97_06020, partial [Erysipelotrichaceae bacterium]|nr:hypothetical protein [Erysipelotrichaceae bacterium]